MKAIESNPFGSMKRNQVVCMKVLRLPENEMAMIKQPMTCDGRSLIVLQFPEEYHQYI
ncbi:hypothetical protein [Ammoniphilus sp. CFH 90114]|uniref:hypothetical protein n=1 Tax=Ammoniphilus sp. CFH 90114 TaxID=2493665 RepID=UPI0013E9622C|nr:hypothetical protein [Ammoniphilus sp. CFH 90114]